MGISIYVESLVRGEMDELWDKTQGPRLHQRWDLRFSDIEYLPRQPGEPQRFLYATRIGAGARIEGAGESVGESEAATGQRTSALKFWSEDRKSLIESGSGYWKYVPGTDGIQFITSYDYQTRFGVLGKIVDKLMFRPLLGWATAWSFDRLRLWIEAGILPEDSRDRALIYTLCRGTIAFVWLYHGLVPKLIYSNPDELRMLREAGVPGANLIGVTSAFGWAEVCLGLIILIFWRSRWPLWFTLLAMVLATAGVLVNSREYVTAAFNPITLNLAVSALTVVVLWLRHNLPTASNCLRRPRESPGRKP